MQAIESFVKLLLPFRECFSEASFSTFMTIVVGWALSPRQRFITDAIITTSSSRKGHHSKYHRFFSQTAWSLDQVCRILALILIQVFCPHGVIVIAVDDTMRRKRGLSLFGAGMHYDPLMSSRSKKIVNWGHCWVVVTLVVGGLPWAPGKYWSLPILFRLYRNRQGKTKGKKTTLKRIKQTFEGGQGQPRKVLLKKVPKPIEVLPHRTKPELCVEMLTLLASWLPNREFLVTGDSAYGGASVTKCLPEKMDLISRAHPKAALYQPAPIAEPGTKGRRRKKGDRLPSKADWANDPTQPWETMKFNQFGLHATLLVKTVQGLYYKSAGTRLVTLVLTRDTKGGREDEVFYCTDLGLTTRQILSTYATRWSIEVTFENSKQLLGFGDAANRLPLAVERTAPLSMILYSLTILWFHQTGHQVVAFPDRPWYKNKTQPSFADMLTTLRRESLIQQFNRLLKNTRVDKTLLAHLIEILSLAG